MHTEYFGGIDIGGTKCAITIGQTNTYSSITIIDKQMFPTPSSPNKAITKMINALHTMVQQHNIKLKSIGISCGSPMNSKQGLILAPPNLPNWKNIDIITPFKNKFNVNVTLCNDANACALAEYYWGNGKYLTSNTNEHIQNMIFLTFGTGMGAGLILNGKLYSGSSDMAGEIGHIRLAENGPTGYNKQGSFEGFCSGGSIDKYIKSLTHNPNTNCKTLFDTASDNNQIALNIVNKIGENLGKGISILIDTLNPDAIIIGGIYTRQINLLEKPMMDIIKKESLLLNRTACKILPSKLGENIGDYASLIIACTNK